jgi:hypothetical protein
MVFAQAANANPTETADAGFEEPIVMLRLASCGGRAQPMLLELVRATPSWRDALAVALTLPPGMPERRQRQDPWAPSSDRPRRISDDLAWLRNAVDEPEKHGLRAIEGSAAAGAWEVTDDARVAEHLDRLEARGVLDAAGFLVHGGQLV